MNNTAVLRLNQTEHSFSLTITLPRPAFRLPRWAKCRRAEGVSLTEARLIGTQETSYYKAHSSDFRNKTFL